jgi:hypothetical protein
MPTGWNHGLFENITRIRCYSMADEATAFLEKLLAGQVDAFCEWVSARRRDNSHLFEKAAVAEEIDCLRRMIPAQAPPSTR